MTHPVDIHVGKQLRMRRTMLGLSQSALAKLTKITFQQVQKYERGANRISASRIYDFAQVLDVPITYFFEGLPVNKAGNPKGSEKYGYAAEEGMEFEHENIAKRETLEMMRNFYRIPPHARKKISEMIRAFADDKVVIEE